MIPNGDSGVVANPNEATLIRENWAERYNTKFYAETVFRQIVNFQYEGMLESGDKVHIRKLPSVTINDYKSNTTAGITYEKPETTKTTLEIDQSKYWAVKINNVDDDMADLSTLTAWTDDASKNMANAVEQDVFANWVTGAAAENQGATGGVKSGDINFGAAGAPLLLTPDNINDHILDVELALNEYNVDRADRSYVIPFWAESWIKRSPDFRDASVSGMAQSSLSSTAAVGMVGTIKLYSSNNLDETTDGAYTVTKCLGVQKKCITFAGTLDQTQMIEKFEADFEKGRRALMVYGSLVTNPEGVVSTYVAKG